MDTMVFVKVTVDKKLPLNTKLGIPALLTDAKDKGSVINIDDITPNDVRHTIPSTPKQLEAEIILLDTSYCAQAIRVANIPSHVLFKYTFEGWTDHDNLDLDMASDGIVELGSKKSYKP